MATLVAGIDSSTQSCKVLICDAETGAIVREGRAKHPDGTQVDPAHWWSALQEAIDAAGGLDDVAAVSVGGQQHGMVVLDSAGEVIRPAMLWNDTSSADAAATLPTRTLFRARNGDLWVAPAGAGLGSTSGSAVQRPGLAYAEQTRSRKIEVTTEQAREIAA